jgi:hypothetical protein
MIDVIPSDTSSSKPTARPSTSATATPAAPICPPASPPAVCQRSRSYLSTALTSRHATSRPSTLSFFLAVPPPAHVCPTETTQPWNVDNNTRQSHFRFSAELGSNRSGRRGPRRAFYTTGHASSRQIVLRRLHPWRVGVRPGGPTTHAESRSAARPAVYVTHNIRNGATSRDGDYDISSDECSPCVGSGHGHGIIIPYTTIVVDAPRWTTGRIAAHHPACGT